MTEGCFQKSALQRADRVRKLHLLLTLLTSNAREHQAHLLMDALATELFDRTVGPFCVSFMTATVCQELSRLLYPPGPPSSDPEAAVVAAPETDAELARVEDSRFGELAVERRSK